MGSIQYIEKKWKNNAGQLVLFFLPVFCVFITGCPTEDPPPPPDPVSASFISDRTTIKVGESIEFTDNSVGEPTSWDWSFSGGLPKLAGGTPGSSSEQNPSVSYAEPGVFDVSLTVKNDISENTMVKKGIIIVQGSGLYYEKTFSGFTKTENVVYGIDSIQHLLHLYEPSGDDRTARPLVILLGGGAFQGSNLDLLEPLARELVGFGVVVAVARFRNGPTENAFEAAVMFIKGQQDSQAAVRFFRKEAEKYRIDPDQIFIGGNGTGAFISYNHAYLNEDEVPAEFQSTVDDLGGLEGLQGNEGYSSHVAGIVALAGGMYNNSLGLIEGNDPPVFAVHGTDDQEVPYNNGTNSKGSHVDGSLAITRKAEEMGLLNYLYTFEGGDHDTPRENPDKYTEHLMAFIREIIIN